MRMAPGELELVRSFVNTLDRETGDDALGEPRALADWLAEHELLDPGTRATGVELRRAIATRPGRGRRSRGGGALVRPGRRLRPPGTDRGRVHSPGRRRGGRSPSCRLVAGDVAGDVEPTESVPGERLRVGVLRLEPQPIGPLVLDGGLWQPREGSRAPRSAEHPVRVVALHET
jgi:Putative stress-induced transcription regulator